MKYAIMVLALVGVLARPTAAIADTKAAYFHMLCLLDPKDCQDLLSYYVMGWRTGYITAQLEAGRQGFFKWDDICIPDKATHGQLADVLVKYLQDHPKSGHETMVNLTLASFIRSFPCR